MGYFKAYMNITQIRYTNLPPRNTQEEAELQAAKTHRKMKYSF
jgi:hypothetical protein